MSLVDIADETIFRLDLDLEDRKSSKKFTLLCTNKKVK